MTSLVLALLFIHFFLSQSSLLDRRNLDPSIVQLLPEPLQQYLSKRESYYRLSWTPPQLPKSIQDGISGTSNHFLSRLPSGRTQYGCFPSGYEVPKFKAKIHELLKDHNVTINDISYRHVVKEDTTELLQLHCELFPVSCKRLLTKTIWIDPSFRVIVAVVPASIFSSFNSTKEDFVVGFSVVGHKSKITESQHRASIEWLLSKGESIRDINLLSNDHFTYLSTFGVVDEFCGIGIGRHLLALTIKDLVYHEPMVRVLAANVIQCNIRAMKFYFRAGFETILYQPYYYSEVPGPDGHGIFIAYNIKNSSLNEKLFRYLPPKEKIHLGHTLD